MCVLVAVGHKMSIMDSYKTRVEGVILVKLMKLFAFLIYHS